MTGELSAAALAQISGAAAPNSASNTRTLANTRATGSASTSGRASGTGTIPRIGSNAQSTGGVKSNTSDTGAAALGYKSGVTVSLAAFMGTAAYLAL